MKQQRKNSIRAAAAAIVGAIALGFLASSCASTQPHGVLYTDVRLPMVAGNADTTAAPKVGVAVANSFLGLVATGDASITAACANGGIRKIHHVDWEANSVLGVFSTYRCVVWGE